jgi:hypothetical protein
MLKKGNFVVLIGWIQFIFLISMVGIYSISCSKLASFDISSEYKIENPILSSSSYSWRIREIIYLHLGADVSLVEWSVDDSSILDVFEATGNVLSVMCKAVGTSNITVWERGYKSNFDTVSVKVLPDITPPSLAAAFNLVPSKNGVLLSWKNPKNSDFFRVQVQRSEIKRVYSLTEGTTVYSGQEEYFNDLGLDYGKSYYYSIFTIDFDGNVSNSTYSSIQLIDKDSPSQPSLFIASPDENNGIILSWVNPDDVDFDSVIVRVGEYGKNIKNYREGGNVYSGSEESCLHTGLRLDVTYNYSIFSKDLNGNYSDPVYVTSQAFDSTPPAVVKNLSVESNASKFNFNWENPDDYDFEATVITLSHSAFPNSLSEGSIVYKGFLDKFYLKDIMLGVPYYFSVFTVDRNDNVSEPIQSFVIIPDSVPPNAVHSFDETPFVNSIFLTWKNPDNFDFKNIELFALIESTDGWIDNTEVLVSGNIEEYEHTGLQPNTEYYYKIVALDEDGYISKAEYIYSKTLIPALEKIVVKDLTFTLALHEVKILEVDLFPEYSISDLKYESSDPSVISVTEDGVLTGLSLGDARILVTSVEYPDISTYIDLSVYPSPISSFELSIDNMSLLFNEVFQVSVSILPSIADQTVTWESSDESIFIVDENGVLTAIGEGVAILSVISKSFPTVFTSVSITVLPETTVYLSTAEEIIDRVIDNQKRITNWSAIYTQTIEGDFFPNGQEELGKITVQGKNIRKDIQRPDRKITIQTETLLIEKDIETNSVTRKDLTLNQNKPSSLQTTPEEALRQANFQLIEENRVEAILEGHIDSIRMVITVDKVKNVATEMSMYLPDGTSFTMYQAYALIDGIHILESSTADMILVIGQGSYSMKSTTTYKMITVNQELSDDVFELEMW